jgi:hypothetical protein
MGILALAVRQQRRAANLLNQICGVAPSCPASDTYAMRCASDESAGQLVGAIVRSTVRGGTPGGLLRRRGGER